MRIGKMVSPPTLPVRRRLLGIYSLLSCTLDEGEVGAATTSAGKIASSDVVEIILRTRYCCVLPLFAEVCDILNKISAYKTMD